MALNKQQTFVSSNEVRWCPGCGDYAILNAMQRFLPTLGLAPEQVVIVSGIGCAGRFPYYVNSYGFHVIHGRAPAVATGIKMMRPDLSVWLVTGDGDGLSIGTNHLIHCLRRNVDINILLLNNQVYGLTKGQVSPTSRQGQSTKTTPHGVKEHPLNPIKIALASHATFVARGLDKDPKYLALLFEQAYRHQGTSFIEIYQNCPIFNDGAFSLYDNKQTRDETVVYLEDNVPLAFGKEKATYLMLNNYQWQMTKEIENAVCFDKTSLPMAEALASLPSDFPLPLGVFYQKDQAIFSPELKHVSAGMDELAALFMKG